MTLVEVCKRANGTRAGFKKYSFIFNCPTKRNVMTQEERASFSDTQGKERDKKVTNQRLPIMISPICKQLIPTV
jgi:hypothetical protein